MTLRVITPPAPLLVPTDISSSYTDDDATIIALIAAATEEIDGPDGWLGRAVGPQTLELRTSEHWHRWSRYTEVRLPCPPLISVTSVKYLDQNRAEQTLDPSGYEMTLKGVLFTATQLPAIAWRFEDALRIQYVAGYNGAPVADGGTGDVPARIKQAITLSVQQLSALGTEDLFLSSEQVEGVGQTSYAISPNAQTLIRSTMDYLLSGLRVYR